MSLILDNSLVNPYYQNYSFHAFPSWRALQEFAQKIPKTPQAIRGNESFKTYVNSELAKANRQFNAYGLNNKQPKSYKDAMERDSFIYYKEYDKIKQIVEKKVREQLQKSSTAEAMKPKFVYNDKQIGEFVFSRAAMTLKPKVFFYSPSRKAEVDIIKDPVKTEKDGKMFLISDNTPVIYAYKVKRKSSKANIDDIGEFTKKTKKINGAIHYEFISDKMPLTDAESELLALGYEAMMDGDRLWVRKEKKEINEEYVFVDIDEKDSLKKARKLGNIQVKSDNKKVYLYKQKKPKTFKSVKILVGMTAGGFTSWTNDFYTGVTAGCVIEILESLDYAVDVEVVVGGGRCGGCYKKLNFDGRMMMGRRFFSFTAKSFNEQLDKDGLLYTLCDPSFHNIKWISLLNNFFSFYGDEVDDRGNPSSTWHGIHSQDMVNPIGVIHKSIDFKKGHKDLLHFYIHQVGDVNGAEQESINDVIRQITDIVLTCENMNLKALEKFSKGKYDI